jgi:polar amino acid transport system substrate-binding protein
VDVQRTAGLMLVTMVLAACGSTQSAPPLKTQGTLTVCSYTDFTPISYGEGQGFEADLARAIGERWDVSVAFVPVTQFDGIWLTPSDSTLGCDIAIGGITPTDARKNEGATFSPTTASFAQSLLVRKTDADTGRITGYASFAGTDMVIGVVPGTTGESFAKQRAQEAGLPMTVLRQYPSEAELLPALRSGEIDAIARGEIGNRHQQAQDPSLVTIDPRDFGEGFAMSVDPSNGQLQTALAQALDAVTKDGAIGYPQWVQDPGILG